MRIVLIGAGNLATNLGKALSRNGHEIVQVFSTSKTAKQLTKQIGGKPIRNLKLLCDDADIYIIALKDSVVEGLLPQICHGRESRLFVHTSGSLPMNIFRGHAKNYGVFYPLQTFSKSQEVDFQQIPCLIEGANAQVVTVLKDLALSISNRVKKVSTEKRRQIHLAAVFACNFTNYCYTVAGNILKQQKLPFDLLLPLIDETARKVHNMSPRKAQTGPAVRNDENIMEQHMEMLYGNNRDLYERMSQSILDEFFYEDNELPF